MCPFIQLRVGDTGSGIDPEIAGKIMEPFFTTKPKEKGTGMGLSVVHGIVRSLNGGIFVTPRKHRGTWFEVYLPISGQEVPADLCVGDIGPVAGGSENILFVDDEEALTQIAQDSLSGFGYRVTAFSDSIDALGAFKENPGAWDLVISDITMPVLPGDALVKEIRRIRPDLPLIKQSPSEPEVIIITVVGSSAGAELAIKNGAFTGADMAFLEFVEMDFLDIKLVIYFTDKKTDLFARAYKLYPRVVTGAFDSDELLPAVVNGILINLMDARAIINS